MLVTMKRGTIIGVCAVVLVLFVIGLTIGLLWPSEDEPKEEPSPMLQMLDAMQQLLTGGGQYDREYYAELRSCMEQLHPDMEASQDAAWQGMIDYWNTRGGVDDSWGSSGTTYMEQNATTTTFLNMVIYEPCNYASNIAFYHDTTEICNRYSNGDPFSYPPEYVFALGKAFSQLAMGSSFMHGSHTKLGHQQDAEGIRVVSYLVHQGSLAAFPDASSVLTDLSPSPRSLNSIEIAEELFQMYLTQPVDQWYNRTDSIDVPDYMLSFSGFFSTVFTLLLDPETVDYYVVTICNAFGVPVEIQNFILEQYLPELRNLTGDFDLSGFDRTKFVANTASTVVKLIYAFLWQEEYLTDSPLFLNETVNELGYELLPEINNMLNIFNTFDYYDSNLQNGTDLYPGDAWCNPVGPHAKWHVEATVGLLDFMYLGDEVYRLLSQ